jgi:hypothetical protein
MGESEVNTGRSPGSRLLGLFRRRAHETEPSDRAEPCAGCGEETVVGSVLFGTRHSFDRSDGGKTFLCDECYAKVRAAKGGKAPTEQDVQVIAQNGGLIGAGFFQGGGW